MPIEQSAASPPTDATTHLPLFGVFLAFVVSYFLHLPARLPVLGLIRADFLLASVCLWTVILNHGLRDLSEAKPWQYLRLLLVYIAVTIPFVQWPGSVIKLGIFQFIKGFAFFPLLAGYLSDEKRVRRFLLVFLACQYLRVFEPLYLHVTQGYWGEEAYVSGSVWLERLAGGPYDVIGANGLAYVIVTILCFFPTLYAICRPWILRAALIASLPVLGYTMLLTGSRSGFLATIVWLGLFVVSSKRKILLLIAGVAVAATLMTTLTPLQYDRVVSIWSDEAQNAGTAEGRMDAVESGLRLALQGPIAGYGLGTSAEAQYNYLGDPHMAHNLFVEALQEVGVVGTMLFCGFLLSIFSLLRQSRTAACDAAGDALQRQALIRGIWLWFLVTLFFALASYGLSSYEWYMLGGLAMVLARRPERAGEALPATVSVLPRGDNHGISSVPGV